jgi:hypothetical protein
VLVRGQGEVFVTPTELVAEARHQRVGRVAANPGAATAQVARVGPPGKWHVLLPSRGLAAECGQPHRQQQRYRTWRNARSLLGAALLLEKGASNACQ